MRDLLLVVAVLAVTGNAFAEVNCPATGIKRISHVANCGLYYECVDGVKVEKVCEDGLSFDETKGICTWPSNNCLLKLKQADLATNILPDVAEERDINQKYNDNLNDKCQFPSDCPSVGHSRYSHGRDCRLYYECNNGRKCLMACYEGHVFNPILGTCDLPKNVPSCSNNL